MITTLKFRYKDYRGKDFYVPINDQAKALMEFKARGTNHPKQHFQFEDIEALKAIGFTIQLELPNRDQVTLITL